MEYFSIDDFSGGNNLLLDPKRIKDNQTLRTSNLVPYAKGVLEKKKGSASYNEIDTGTIVATMTDYDAPASVVISASNAPIPDTYPIWQAFDGNTLTWASMFVGDIADEAEDFIKVDLGTGNSEKITGISLLALSGWGIKDFTLQGSNNDSSWTTILANQETLNNGDWQTFSFNETSAYRYFKIIINSQYAGIELIVMRQIKIIQAPYKINNMVVTQIGSAKYVIAAANYRGAAVNDVIYQSKNGAAFVAMTAATGVDTLTPQSDYTFAINHLGHIYMSNGVDNMQVSTNGEARADVAFTTGSLTPNGKFILWWKDRLWVAGDSTDPHAVFYSDNLDPTTFNPASVLYCGGKDSNDPIMGIIPLTLTSANEGLVDTLAVFRKNSIYVIGFDTAPTYIDQLSGVIGCWDSKSICNTPLGVMFVGKNNVYSLGVSGEPSPIGSAIKPIWDGSNTNGRATATRSVAAIYFDGFVRFAYPHKDVTYNNREYWLDIRDYSNVGWFGDHVGLNINCYAVDGNTIYAGSAINGEVWKLEQSSYSNMSANILAELQTKHFTLDNSEYTTKIMKRFCFNVMPRITEDVTIYYSIDKGKKTGSKKYTPVFSQHTSAYPPVNSDTYVKATTALGATTYPHYATNSSKSLTGAFANNTWASEYDAVTNQRFHIDLGSAKIITKIYYENYHAVGTATGVGAKTFTFWGSNTAGAFAELTYATDTDWTQLTTSQSTFDRHKEEDAADPKYITVTNTTAYRYYAFKFADIWDAVMYLNMGVRRIELQEGDVLWREAKGFFTSSDRGRFIGYTISETSNNNISIQNGLMSYIKTGRLL